MIAFGVFVLLGVGVIAVFALVASDEPAVVNLLGFDFETTERWQFATGALCALSAVIAIRIIAIGWRRARRRRRELHELRETVSQQTLSIPEHGDDRDRTPIQPDRDRKSTQPERDAWDDRDRKSTPSGRHSWDDRDPFDSTPRD